MPCSNPHGCASLTMKLLPSLLLLSAAVTPCLAGNPSAYGYNYGAQPSIASYGYAPGPALQSPISQPGWSVGLRGGAFWLNDVHEDISTSAGVVDASLSFDRGWAVTVPFTYQFGDGLSLGMSVGYATAQLGAVSGTLAGVTQSIDVGGKVSMIPVMANVGYTVPLTDSLSWHFGGGAGGVYTSVKVNGDTDSNSSWNLGFQGFTSIDYVLHEQALLNFGYRYTLAKDPDADLQGHTIEAGVTFRF
jgi:opacity protein-like surface antigen